MTKHRGRLPFLFFASFYLLLFFVLGTSGWTNTWELLSVHTMSPPFADMRTVQGALQSERDGFDPFVENPGDPWGRELNYPAVWLEIARLLSLDHEFNYRAFVVSYLMLFLCCVGVWIYRYPSWILALAAVSGATLMGIERGNNDLLVFGLLFVALMVTSMSTRGLLVLLCSVLKLYPIIASVSLLEGFPRRGLGRDAGGRPGGRGPLVLLSVVALLGLYVAVNYTQLLRGISVTPSGGSMTYGVGVLAFLAEERFPWLGLTRPLIYAFFILAFLLAALFSKRIAIMVQFPAPRGGRRAQISKTAFIVGALIYVTTFMVGNSWDYRMIFCLLCVPFMMTLGWRPLRHAFALSLLLALNQFLLFDALGFAGGVITVFGKIMLMLILMTVLVARVSDLIRPVQAGSDRQVGES